MCIEVLCIVLEAVTGHRECPRFLHRYCVPRSICYCVADMQTGVLFILDASRLVLATCGTSRGHQMELFRVHVSRHVDMR